MNVKNIVDVLSSIASIVAIVSVLIAWFRSSRRPLKLNRLLINKKKASTTLFLYFINRQAYPVKIKSMRCFKKIIYVVSQKNDNRPEMAKKLDYDELVFENLDDYEVEAHANCSLNIKLDDAIDTNLTNVVLSMKTSHGYHLLKCKNIDVVDMGGDNDGYMVPLEKSFDSRIKSKFFYMLVLVKYYAKRFPNKMS